MTPIPPSDVQIHNRNYQSRDPGWEGKKKSKENEVRERKRRPPPLNGFNMPIPSDKHLFHIKYWLEVLLHKGERRPFFMALKGEHKIKGARI